MRVRMLPLSICSSAWLAIISCLVGLPTMLRGQMPFPPTVGISPGSGNVATPQTLNVQITWCSNTQLFDSTSRHITFNGQDVTSTFSYGPQGGVVSCTFSYVSNGRVTPQAGLNPLTASIKAAGVLGSDSVSYTVGPTVTVTAAASVVLPTGGANALAVFTIKNIGSVADTFTVVGNCSGIAITTCGTPTTPVILPAGASRGDTITFTAGSAGQIGLVTLIATSPTHGESQSASTRVKIRNPTGLSVSTVNSGATVERSLCLTIAVSPAAAYECGDLRIIHPLPSARTYNKVRTPTLLYRDRLAWGAPIFAALLTMPASGNKPDSVTAAIKVRPSGTTQAYTSRPMGAHWVGADFADGTTYRIASAPDMHADSTGLYDYILTTSRWYGNVPTNDTASGQLPLINRERSYFGAGWWLAGLERLIPTGTGFFWVGGDGSSRYYALAHDSVYTTTPLLNSRDSLTKHGGGQYIRWLPHGMTVYFNLNGQHVATVDRLGHATNFTYDGQSRVIKIAFPAPGASVYDTLLYGNANGTLSSVIQKAPNFSRTVTLTDSVPTAFDPAASVVRAITDPDSLSVRFTYDAPLPVRIGTRTDKRGTTATFVTGGVSLDNVTIAMGSGNPNIVRSFNNVDEAGFSAVWEGAPQHPGIPDSAEDVYYGPRFNAGGDSADVTHFWLDQYGELTRVVDAHHGETDLARSNLTYLAAVTAVRYPSGQFVAAAYDGRGNLGSETDVTTLVGGQNPTTNYTYDGKFDFVTKIDPPLHDWTSFTYDATDGNRLTEQNATGAASQITFNYSNAYALLSSTVLPGTPADLVLYDAARGNVAATHTPIGYWTLYRTDSVGRTVLVIAPDSNNATDSTNLKTTGTYAYHTYSMMDRDVEDSTVGPAMDGVAQQTAIVRTTYDAVGGPTQVVRLAKPDPAGIGSLVTETVYDAAERPVKAIAVDGNADSTIYDAAGNAVRVLTRRGYTLTMTYDALNRVLSRTVPAASYSGTWTYNIPAEASTLGPPDSANDPPYGGLTVPANNQAFTYDAMGHITEADNAYAHVNRSYRIDGSLAQETQAIRTLTGTDFTQHVYTVAYGYDADKRRDTVYYPPALLATANGPVGTYERFVYDAASRLDSVIDPLGVKFHYGYTARGDQDTTVFDIGGQRVRTYDADGNLASEVATENGTQSRNATIQYDARGKIVNARNTQGIGDSLSVSYSGLGFLVADVTHWHSGFSYLDTEHFTTDALGNQMADTSIASIGSGTNTRQVESFWHYAPTTGRLSWGNLQSNSIHDTTAYDAAGNVAYAWQTVPSAQYAERASYYQADDKLWEADYRGVYPPVFVHQGPYTRGVEQYWHDALGRRVLVWTHQFCSGLANLTFQAGCYTLGRSSVRRTVWDGQQELAEVQVQDSLPDNSAADTAHVKLPIGPQTGSNWLDNNRFFGRVLYTIGTDVDLPLSITRIDYADSSNDKNVQAPYILQAPHTLVPVWNYHAQWDAAIFEQPCPADSQGNPRCMFFQLQGNFFANDQVRDTLASWMGSLLQSKLDGAGTLYRRARVYDPTTGRFTQEDPIGLAGGLNSYRFANGDPVNYSDPFGLCDPMPECLLFPAIGGGELGGLVSGPLAPIGIMVGAALGAAMATDPGGTVAIPSTRAAADATAVNYTAGGRFTPRTKRITEDRVRAANGGSLVCEYCGIELQDAPGSPRSKEHDHFKPRSRGGDNSPDNDRLTCRDCNREKGATDPTESP